MVNTALCRARGHYAWATAVVYQGAMGSALCNERFLHLRDYSRPIPDDFLPPRLAFFHPGSVVANHRPWNYRDDHGATGILDPALPRWPNEESLSSRPRRF